MKQHLLLLALATGMQTYSLESAAAVMDFESLYHDDLLVADAGLIVVEDGYRVAQPGPMPFGTYGAQDSEFIGSTAVFNDNDNGVTTLTKANGRLFSLISIDLAELIVGTEVSYSVEFTGLTAAAGSVTQGFTLDGRYGAQTFLFDGRFIDLFSVSWVNSAGYHQFDNIEAVPEPATLAMALSGMALMGGLARRRRQPDVQVPAVGLRFANPTHAASCSCFLRLINDTGTGRSPTRHL